jgi:hypothetical protein
MANSRDGNCVFVFGIEENAMVATAKAETGKRRFKLFHVARAADQIAIDTVENLQRDFAVDGTQICSGLHRPDNGDSLRRHPRSLSQPELAQDLFVRNGFPASKRTSGAIQRRSRIGRDFFFLERS